MTRTEEYRFYNTEMTRLAAALSAADPLSVEYERGFNTFGKMLYDRFNVEADLRAYPEVDAPEV